MDYKLKTKVGFTLIEVLVALFISVLMLLFSTAILANFNKRIQHVEIELDALRLASNRMEDFIYKFSEQGDFQVPLDEVHDKYIIEYRTEQKRDLLTLEIIIKYKNNGEKITSLKRIF